MSRGGGFECGTRNAERGDRLAMSPSSDPRRPLLSPRLLQPSPHERGPPVATPDIGRQDSVEFRLAAPRTPHSAFRFPHLRTFLDPRSRAVRMDASVSIPLTY